MVKSECGFRLSRRLWGGMKNELSIPKNACQDYTLPVREQTVRNN